MGTGKKIAEVVAQCDLFAASGENYVVKVLGEFEDGTFYIDRAQAEKRCEEINAADAARLKSSLEALREKACKAVCKECGRYAAEERFGLGYFHDHGENVHPAARYTACEADAIRRLPVEGEE